MSSVIKHLIAKMKKCICFQVKAQKSLEQIIPKPENRKKETQHLPAVAA